MTEEKSTGTTYEEVYGAYQAEQAAAPTTDAAPAAAAAVVTEEVFTQTPTNVYETTIENAQNVIIDQSAIFPMTESDKTLRLVAYILNLITTIGCGFFVIPLAWMIPMTVISWKIYKGMKPNTVAFGVCTLLFINMISGILLLVSTKNEKVA